MASARQQRPENSAGRKYHPRAPFFVPMITTHSPHTSAPHRAQPSRPRQTRRASRHPAELAQSTEPYNRTAPRTPYYRGASHRPHRARGEPWPGIHTGRPTRHISPQTRRHSLADHLLVSITSHYFRRFYHTTPSHHTMRAHRGASSRKAFTHLAPKLVARATVAFAYTRDSTRDSTALHHRAFLFSCTRPHSQCRVCAKCRLHRLCLHHIHNASSHYITPRLRRNHAQAPHKRAHNWQPVELDDHQIIPSPGSVAESDRHARCGAVRGRFRSSRAVRYGGVALA